MGGKNSLALRLWRWCLLLVLISGLDEFVWKYFWLLIMQFVIESIYWHRTGTVCNCLNRLLHEVCCAPAIILTIFSCKVKIFLLSFERKFVASYGTSFVVVKFKSFGAVFRRDSSTPCAIDTPLTVWRRNFLLNFCTPCI